MKTDLQSAIGKNSSWFLLWGILLIILGIVAISLAEFTTLVSVIVLGLLILAGGIVIIIDAFKFWWGSWGRLVLSLILGILYIIVGIMLLENPIWAATSLTLFLGIFYVVIGIIRLFYAVVYRSMHWGWLFFNGIISLILGILILASWPGSSLIIIGLFVGIDLLVSGWFYLMLGISGRALAEKRV